MPIAMPMLLRFRAFCLSGFYLFLLPYFIMPLRFARADARLSCALLTRQRRYAPLFCR